ncbi:P-loop NTPase fold protein [Actinophytocola sediminis]
MNAANAPTSGRSPLGVRLGEAGGLGFWVARTSQPWTLGIDGIVVSVGTILGDLGLAVQRRFPDADWGSVPLREVTPGTARLLPLPGDPLRLAVLSSVHNPLSASATELRGIVTATVASARAADRAEVSALGMPLMGTGALGFPVDEAAEAVVGELSTAFPDPPRHLRDVVFLCNDARTERAIVEAWWRHAEEPQLAGGVSSDLVPPNRGIPLSADRLGVAPYVSMLATVIADRNTPPPLSIGVFGAWGSGKSYFMGLLRHRVAELAGSGADRYCATIEQIGFNAWHYADSNLWASLGDHIFGHLAGPDSSAPHRRERLRAELTKVLDQRQELADAADRARREAVELRARADDAAASQQAGAKGLLRSLPGAAAHWARMGVTDEHEQGELLGEQLRGTLAEADALRRAPKDRRGRLVLAVAAVVAVAVAFGIVALPAWREWLAGIGAVATAVAGAGVAWMAGARAGLRGLRALVARLPAEQREQVVALRRTETEQRIAEAALDEAVVRVGELGRRLTELAPGHRLYSFLAERAHGEAYAGNLGLISTIRKDFEQLVTLLTDWRDHPGEDDQPPIDRIVLYIDDLDRCSPRQVVDVLQAVHLLLAMELFVVVVGVDPRWLLRSLASCHHEIFEPRPGDWQATPADYLEKILNIPLVLPGMTQGSLSELLRSMVDAVEEPAGAEPAPVSGQGSVPAPEIQIEPGAELATYRPTPPRPLTEPELALLSTLDSMVDSPRAAKRLMNLYRMVRATRDLSPASRFLGTAEEPGEYEAVVVLLGLLTAHATLLARALDTPPDEPTGLAGGLLHRDQDSGLGEFVADLEPRWLADGWHNRVVGALAAGEVARWRRLHAALGEVLPRLGTTSLRTFHLWVPRVRRFSYVLSG